MGWLKSLCPFPACPDTYPILGSIPGDVTLHTDPCESCQQPCLAGEPAWTWLRWFQFGVRLCTSPSLYQERAPWGWGMSMPSLFLCSWVAFAVSPARCDLQGCSSFPQPILTPVAWGFTHCKTRRTGRALIPGLLWHRTPSTPTCRAAGVFVTAGPQPWH